MNELVISLIRSFLIGFGATITFDLWGLFLRHVFQITPSNFCLIGRWILYMPAGIFKHSNIGSAAKKGSECLTGWIAHYVIGITFAVIFVTLAGGDWPRHPTVAPAILFGTFTVTAPFFIMHPALGLGIAASKTPNPTQARLRSLMNHAVFGFGLYIFGLLVSWLL